MIVKNNTKVIIGGSVYTLSGVESEEYIQRVALYINNKLDELKSSENGQLLNSRMMNILLAINIADDYFKAKEGTVKMDQDFVLKEEHLQEKEREIIELQENIHYLEKEKNKLVSRIEELQGLADTYKAELDEYIETFDLEKE